MSPHSLTVLVVDDHDQFRQLVCSLLRRRADLQVVGQASDGLEAVQKAERLKPDLILLDIHLPNLSGIEAARQMLELVPAVRIVFLSQESSSDVVQEALSFGALGYVHKTRTGSELLPAIEAALARRIFVTPEREN